MTCDVSSTPSSQVFSPLTLFECTVTNAQMLVESMADRELLRALKIANSLHTHIVGIMEPRYDRVCQRSDEHDACQLPPPSLIINRRRHLTPTPPNQHELLQQPASKLAKIKMCTNGGALSPSSAGFPKVEPSVEQMGEALHDVTGADEESSTGAAALGAYPDENFLDEEDDCLLVEDSCEGVLGSGAGAGVSALSAPAGIGQLPRRRQRRQPRRSSAAAASASAADDDDNEGGFSGADLSGLGIAGAPGSQTDVASLCKSAIHLAYKEMKGSGPHLFDFSLPFSDPVNSTAAEQVINRAMQLQPQVDVPPDVWWKSLGRQFSMEKYNCTAKFRMRRHRYMCRKLTRRQKSFELIAPTLNTEAFDKFRLILSRDYTSSDEEAEDFPPSGGGSSTSATAFAGAPLRVRELPWESDEMGQMKRQLDAAYLESCATARQTEQLRRVSRGTGCVSARPPPADCPNWAIRRDDGGGAGVGSILE